MLQNKRKIYLKTKSSVHIYREILESLTNLRLSKKGGDSSLYFFIYLYAHAYIGNRTRNGVTEKQGQVVLPVDILRKAFRAPKAAALYEILDRMQEQGLLTYNTLYEKGKKVYVDIQLSGEYTHYVNKNGSGTKQEGYVLLTMKAVEKIIGMAERVTEMDGFLDLLLHAVVRDSFVVFSRYPVVCFPDTGRFVCPDYSFCKDQKEQEDDEMEYYEPTLSLSYFMKRWKVSRHIASVRLDTYVRRGLITKVMYRGHVGDLHMILFVPDAIITGDDENIQVHQTIDRDYIIYEVDHHFEQMDRNSLFRKPEHALKTNTLRICTKDNPTGREMDDDAEFLEWEQEEDEYKKEAVAFNALGSRFHELFEDMDKPDDDAIHLFEPVNGAYGK